MYTYIWVYSQYIHTHICYIEFQPKFIPKLTSFLVSLCQWVNCSSCTYIYIFNNCTILVLDKIQSPERPYMNQPFPISLASSAFLSLPCISRLSLLSVSQTCQGFVALLCDRMPFHHCHKDLAPCHSRLASLQDQGHVRLGVK